MHNITIMNKRVTISIDEKLLERIDKARGLASRSAWIAEILRRSFVNTSSKSEVKLKRRDVGGGYK